MHRRSEVVAWTVRAYLRAAGPFLIVVLALAIVIGAIAGLPSSYLLGMGLMGAILFAAVFPVVAWMNWRRVKRVDRSRADQAST